MFTDDVFFQQRLHQKNELLDSCSVAEKDYENLRNYVLQINAMWIISSCDSSLLLYVKLFNLYVMIFVRIRVLSLFYTLISLCSAPWHCVFTMLMSQSTDWLYFVNHLLLGMMYYRYALAGKRCILKYSLARNSEFLYVSSLTVDTDSLYWLPVHLTS